MIYAIRTNKMRSGFIKIGYTSNPVKRIPALRTACPYETELIFLGPGEKQDEDDLHQKFAHKKRKGEWFTDCEEIRNHFGFKFMNKHQFKAPDYWRSMELYFYSHKSQIFTLKAACTIWAFPELHSRENRKFGNFEILNVNIAEVMENYSVIGKASHNDENDFIILPLFHGLTYTGPSHAGSHNRLFPLVQPSLVFNNKYGTHIAEHLYR